MTLLETKGATMQFGGLIAVNDLNLSIEQGKIVAVIGPNGAGKTTAFNMITGVYSPTKGDILYQGNRINGTRPDQITRMGIGRTFQNIRLFKALTVLDNVLIANHLRVKSGLFSAALHLPAARREERQMAELSLELLRRTGLEPYANDISSSLPYGLQRRLEIARALATQPKLLLLDEPAAGMNPRETDELSDFIREIRDAFSLTILLIEHHMQLVMNISDSVYVLEYGNTIAHDVPKGIRENPAVIKAYLGEED